MTDRLTDHFDKASAPWDGSYSPPPWPTQDVRTIDCRHEPTGTGWAIRKGERQRHCVHCDRWVWAHNITPPQETP